jgi:cytochrome c oxidase subunit I+III
VAAQALAIAGLAWLGLAELPRPESHAYAAASWALLAYAALHALLALLCAGFVLARLGSGHLRPGEEGGLEAAVARLFGDYAGAATLVVLACLLAPVLLL